MVADGITISSLGQGDLESQHPKSLAPQIGILSKTPSIHGVFARVKRPNLRSWVRPAVAIRMVTGTRGGPFLNSILSSTFAKILNGLALDRGAKHGVGHFFTVTAKPRQQEKSPSYLLAPQMRSLLRYPKLAKVELSASSHLAPTNAPAPSLALFGLRDAVRWRYMARRPLLVRSNLRRARMGQSKPSTQIVEEVDRYQCAFD